LKTIMIYEREFIWSSSIVYSLRIKNKVMKTKMTNFVGAL